MSDPFPIFNEDLNEQIMNKIKVMDMAIRLKAIAINYNINLKKELDKNLENEIQELVRWSEKKKFEIQKKENQIITGERFLNLYNYSQSPK